MPTSVLLASLLDRLQAEEASFVRWFACEGHRPWLDALLLESQEKTVAVPLLLAVLLVLGIRRPRRALRALLTCAAGFGLAMGLASVLWFVIDRPRPPAVYEEHLRTEEEIATCESHPDALVLRKPPSGSPSFPSRHGLTIGVFATAVWLASWPVGVLAALYGLLAGVGRVYAAKHYPSDVVVGVLLGIAIALLTWRLVPRVLGRWGRAGLVLDPPPPPGPSVPG